MRQFVVMTAILMAVGLVLAACGGTDEAPTGDVSPGRDTVTEPTGDKRVVIGQGELVSSFDPPTDWAIAATWIHSNLGDCLVWKDRDTGDFVPWLAESWDVLDGQTWRFNLREGVTFHNGEPFNAEAAKFTIDRIMEDEKMITHNQWTFINQVTAVDEYTVEITTDNPEPAMLSKMAGTGCQVVPPGYVQEVGPEQFAREPVGTGPFKFVEERKDDRVVVEAFDDYWQGRPDIDELVFRAIPESSTRINELLTGGVDLIVNVPAQDWQRLEDNSETNLVVAQGNATMLMILRLTDQDGGTYVTSDERIRAAIEHAIDKNAVVDLIGGTGVPTRTRITPPTFSAHEGLYGPEDGDLYDPDRARALLEEAGYDGEPLQYIASTGRWLMTREVAEAITAMLQQVGFTVDLSVLDVTTFNEQYYYPSYEGQPVNEGILMDALGNSFFDPWIAVLGFHSARWQRTGYSNPRVDELIDAAGQNMDFDERAEQYREVQEIIAEERPSIFLYHMKDTYGMSSRLEWAPGPDAFLWMGNATVR